MMAQMTRIMGRKMIGENTVGGLRARRGILMQMSTEDEHAAIDGGAAGEREVAAEDQNVAGH